MFEQRAKSIENTVWQQASKQASSSSSSKMRVFADLSVSRWRVMEVLNAEVYLVASDVVK